jgi:hypothetical protein
MSGGNGYGFSKNQSLAPTSGVNSGNSVHLAGFTGYQNKGIDSDTNMGASSQSGGSGYGFGSGGIPYYSYNPSEGENLSTFAGSGYPPISRQLNNQCITPPILVQGGGKRRKSRKGRKSTKGRKASRRRRGAGNGNGDSIRRESSLVSVDLNSPSVSRQSSLGTPSVSRQSSLETISLDTPPVSRQPSGSSDISRTTSVEAISPPSSPRGNLRTDFERRYKKRIDEVPVTVTKGGRKKKSKKRGKRRGKKSRRQRGGSGQYMSNIANSHIYSTGAPPSLGPNESMLAYPPPYTPKNDCMNSWKHLGDTPPYNEVYM